MLLPVAAAAAQDPQAMAWLPVVLVPGMWLLVGFVLALASGHLALLARFPPDLGPVERRFSFASGTMRWVSFNNALHVALSARGLHLAPGWLFRPLTHRGIPCIPWAEIRCTRPQPTQGWFARTSRFEIPRIGLKFQLAGGAGLAVEAALRQRAGAGEQAGPRPDPW